MLRTNSKAARENVRAYILANCEDIRDTANYDGGEMLDTVGDVCEYIKNDFKRVMAHEFKRVGYQDAFSEYASGLPFNVFDYHYNVSAVDLVGDILDETTEERERFSESEAERLMDYLIFRECRIF